MTINHEYTYRMLYGKYAWKVKLVLPSSKIRDPKTKRRLYNQSKTDILRPVMNWLTTNHLQQYRLLKSWRVKRSQSKDLIDVCYLTVFLDNQDAYDGLVSKFNANVQATMAPANEHHADLIKQGAHIEIRSKLYYNLYRYRVSFWGGWWGDTRKEILHTINNCLNDDTKKVQDYRVYDSDCTLYLKESKDLMMIKLSLSEKIRDTRAIALTSEI